MLSNSDNMLSSDNMAIKYMLTKIEQETITKLALEGPQSGYDFDLGGKRQRGKRKALMSSGWWPKVRNKLCELSLIKPLTLKGKHSNDERGRRKDLYSLTFNGLIYSLKLKAINSTEAHKVRLQHQIDLSTPIYRSLVEDMEKNYPEAFYEAFVTSDIGASDTTMTLAALLILLSLPMRNPEHFKKYVEGNDIVLSDGPPIRDYREGLEFFVKFLGSMLPEEYKKGLQTFLNEKPKEN